MEFLIEITRQVEGKQPELTYAITDSPSVKTVGASEQRGVDGGKRIKGRKRHIVVDVLGNLLAIVVHTANIHDTVSALLPPEKLSLLIQSLEDSAQMLDTREHLRLTCGKNSNVGLIFLKRLSQRNGKCCHGGGLLKALAWLNTFRRLSMDYERITFSAESFAKIAHLHKLMRNSNDKYF